MPPTRCLAACWWQSPHCCSSALHDWWPVIPGCIECGGCPRQRHWALDLRLSLLVLFFLAWIAQKSGTSILIAGFGAGLMVALLGGPKRLSTQIRGIADGFFIPLYFVILGAQLDLHGLIQHPALLALTGALAMLTCSSIWLRSSWCAGH